MTIGAPFRVECGAYRCQPSSKPGHHFLNDVVSSDPQRFAKQLGRQVPVAEMPRDPHEMGKIPGFDFDKVFRLGQYFDYPPVLQFEAVTVVKVNRAGLVEQEREAARTRQNRPPAVSVIQVEGDPVHRVTLPVPGAMNSQNPDHCAASTFSIIDLKAGRSLRRFRYS